MAETKEGGFAIGGMVGRKYETHWDRDMMLMRLNKNGELLWSKKYGSPNGERLEWSKFETEDWISDLIVTKDNSIVALGIYNGQEVFAMKIQDPYSGIEIAETVEELLSISPNPAKEYFIIKNRGKSSEYRITTGLGELVKTGEILEGNNKIDLEGFASGVYYIRFKNSLEVKKIVVAK